MRRRESLQSSQFLPVLLCKSLEALYFAIRPVNGGLDVTLNLRSLLDPVDVVFKRKHSRNEIGRELALDLKVSSELLALLAE